MRVFITGATGFIGSAIVRELLAAGHQVLGLARSDTGASSLAAAGAQVHRGELEDLESLRRGAAVSDGVIHLAFDHDFSNYAANCEADRHAIEALGSPLVGSGRPLVVTSGTAMASTPGRLVTEEDAPVPSANGMPRSASEEAAASIASRGVRVSVVRLPQVHDRFKQGLVSFLIALAREKGVSAFVGDGLNRWPAVHLLDVAHLYCLALEKETGGARYHRFHGVGEEGVRLREIAQVIGRRLSIPVVALAHEQAAEHFGWLGMFVSFDAPASSAQTRKHLGWRPTGVGLLEDLENARDLEI